MTQPQKNEIDAARTGEWVVIGESSSYWDVAEKLSGLCAPTQAVNEVAYSPVCRVKRHIPGKENLAKILAVNDLLAACKEAVRLYESYGLLAQPTHGLEPGKWINATVAAIAKAEAAT